MKKKGWKTAILVVLVAAVVSSPAFAARGGRGRGGRLGPGFGRDLPGGLCMGPRGGSMRPGGPGMYGRGGGPGMGPQCSALGPGGPGMLGRGGGPGASPMPLRILRSLDLTEEQVDAVKKIIEEGKEKSEAAKKAVAEATKGLHEAVIKGDEAGIREAATNVGKAIGDEAVLKASKMTAVKKVLTDEQREELEELMAKLKERAEKSPEGIKGSEFGPGFQRFGRRGDMRGPGQHFGRGQGMGAGRGPGPGGRRGGGGRGQRRGPMGEGFGWPGRR